MTSRQSCNLILFFSEHLQIIVSLSQSLFIIKLFQPLQRKIKPSNHLEFAICIQIIQQLTSNYVDFAWLSRSHADYSTVNILNTNFPKRYYLAFLYSNHSSFIPYILKWIPIKAKTTVESYFDNVFDRNFNVSNTRLTFI